MNRPREFDDTREHLLATGEAVIRGKGFAGVGLSEILTEAGVPKGSFYHYFPSKDDLGYALVNAYGEAIMQHLQNSLQQHPGSSLQALQDFFLQLITVFEQDFGQCNCMLGNLGQELAGQHAGFREVLQRHFQQVERTLAAALTQAQNEGDLTRDQDTLALARLLFSGWEGALMRAKLEQSPLLLRQFVQHFFQGLPRPA